MFSPNNVCEEGLDEHKILYTSKPLHRKLDMEIFPAERSAAAGVAPPEILFLDACISCREKARGLPCHHRFFKRICQPDQNRLAPSSTEERDSNRQSIDVARRDGDARVARNRSCRRAAAQEMVASHEIADPCRTFSRGNERIKIELLHDRVNSLCT